MKKVVEIIKKIRLGLKNPKTKSLTLLGIYSLFFIFVFVVLNMSKNNTLNTSSISENESVDDKTVSSYEYAININNNNLLTTISGTYSNNEEIFNFNNNKYYVKDDIVYILDNGVKTPVNLDINIKNYRYDKLEEIIKNSKFIEKTVYNDDREKSTYNIDIKKYFELLNQNIDCNIVNCNIVIPITVEAKENINKVILDFNSYFNYNYIIEINYSNINNIKELKISTLSE